MGNNEDDYDGDGEGGGTFILPRPDVVLGGNLGHLPSQRADHTTLWSDVNVDVGLHNVL